MSVKRPFVFVLPGGAYEVHARHEAEPVADWLRTAGVDAEVLYYPLAPSRHPVARDYVADRIRLVRNSSDRPVGLLGFSAGAHLAGDVAWSATDLNARPDFVGLAYPVTDVGDSGHRRSGQNLFGDEVTGLLGSSSNLPAMVAPGGPPVFIWHTADDEVVPVSHSIQLAAALAQHSVPFELHVFPEGPHGLGLKDGRTGIWMQLFLSWLSGPALRNHRRVT